MSTRKRSTIALLTMLMVMASIASCAQATTAPEPTQPTGGEAAPTEPAATVAEPTTPAEPVTLEVWFLSQSPEEMQNIEAMSTVFEGKHPGVTVKVSPYSFDDMLKTMKLALDSGTGPDVAYGQPGQNGTWQYAAAGKLVDLTPYVKSLGWDQEQPTAAITYWMKSPTDPVYAVPFDTTDVGVFYNTKIYADLGLTPPTTFDDFQNILASVKKAGITPFSLGAMDGWTLDHYFQALVHVAVPIDEIRKIYLVEPGASYLQSGMLQAATILKDWIDKGYFNDGFLGMGYDDQNNLFISGKTAMNLGGTWNNGTFIAQAKDETGFFALPRVNPDLEWHAILTPNNVWMIPVFTKHVDYAVDYIDFMLGEDVALSKWKQGDIPGYKFDALPQPIAKLQGDVYAATQQTGIGYYFTDDPQLMQAEQSALQALAGGTLTPQETMAQIDKVLQQLIAAKQ